MRYLGGKYRLRKQIAEVIKDYRGLPLSGAVKSYWEPFVGSGWVTTQIDKEPIYASDINKELIILWNRLQQGWEPPTNITEKQYEKAKNGKYPDHLTAFIGFGCSWGGKWFGGYARGEDRNWAKEAHDSLLNKIDKLQNVKFFQANFLQVEPPEDNMVIYCDPPYKGTTGYKGAGDWKANKFWQRVRRLSKKGHKLLVSEYQAPNDFHLVWQQETKTDLNTKDGKEKRIEKIFTV